MKDMIGMIRAFGQDESGVALTEYLILLGLLVGGVIITVQIAGNNLNAVWTDWAAFWTSSDLGNPLNP